MDDKERRDKALLNYLKAILDEPNEYPDEKIIGALLQPGAKETFVQDMKDRMETLVREHLTNNLQ